MAKPMYSPAKGIGSKSDDGQWIFTNKGWVATVAPVAVTPTTVNSSAPVVTPAPVTTTDPVAPAPTPSPVATSDEEKAKEKADADAKRQAQIDERTRIETERLKFEAGIKPDAAAPATPDLEKTFEELRAQGGVVKIEDEINAIRTEKADLMAQYLKFKREEPKGVSAGFASGRISDEQQAVQDRLDFLTRQENASISNLNNKSKYIETVMSLTGQEYDNAVANYDKEFSKNLQMQQAFSSQQNIDKDNARAEVTAQQTEQNRQRDDSRAYLTSVTNLIQNSGKSWDAIDDGMKADIKAAELRAGYAPGTLEAFARAKPKTNLLGSRDGYDASGNAITSLIYDNGTGIPQVTIVKTGGTKTGETGADTGLRTTAGLQKFVNENPDITIADIYAKLDTDAKLSASSIEQLIGQVNFPLDDTTVNSFITRINEEDGLNTTDSKGVQSHIPRTVIQDQIATGEFVWNGKFYKPTAEQLTKIKEAIRTGGQKFWPGGR